MKGKAGEVLELVLRDGRRTRGLSERRERRKDWSEKSEREGEAETVVPPECSNRRNANWELGGLADNRSWSRRDLSSAGATLSQALTQQHCRAIFCLCL